MAHSETDTRWPEKLQRQLLGRNFLRCYHIFCRVVCLTTVAVQLALIDYYLIYNTDLWALLWIVADLAVVALLIATVIASYRHLVKRPIIPANSHLRRCGGELPLTFLSWFLYSTVLSAKIVYLYGPVDGIASRLDEKNFFGPNMLRTAVSLASIVLYLLILTSHDARSQSAQSGFIVCITGSVYLDVLDTTQFLGALMEDSKRKTSNAEDHRLMESYLHVAIVVIICFNFILPTEGLFVLSRKHFGKVRVEPKFQLLHKICYFIAVNLPFFVVRMMVWHMNDQNVSVFLVKNLIGIGLAIKDIHEFTIEITEVVRDELKMEQLPYGLAPPSPQEESRKLRDEENGLGKDKLREAGESA